MAIVIVKNITGSSIFIDDLGIDVDGSGQLNLSELFDFEDISGSDDLKILVQNGSFTINDGVDDLSVSDGMNHIYHQTVYEDSFEDGGGVSLLAEQLHSVQARRTTGLALSTSWQDIYFDTTDVENDSEVVEHSDTDSDRILIKDSGYYLIHYSFQARSDGATRYCYSRVRLNDTSDVEGSSISQDLYRDETHQQVSTVVKYLTTGDFISLQISAGSTPIQAYSDFVLVAIKLEGIRGAQGEKGADGSIIGTLELPALQIRRTTDIDEIPLSWMDITFDTTDLETYPDKIEHNNTNTDRVEIKEDGTYFITYSYEIDDEAYTRIRINDSQTLIGSERHMGDVTQEGDLVAAAHQSCIASLSSGDFLTLQTYSTTTYEHLYSDIVLTVHKLEGIKGDKGDTGDTGSQGIQGPPGEASSINSTGDLDEAKVTDIENNSGASDTELYFYLVQSDIRIDNTTPSGINGDMSTHVVMYDGTSWTDIGPFVGIKGDKGDTGDTGPPGADGADGVDGNSVKVQKDGGDIMSNIATLNFTGSNVTVTTSASSKVNVAIGSTQICQVYDGSGGTSVNNSTPVALPFNQQIIKDSIYTHSTSSNNSRIYVTTSGYYKLTYTMNYDSDGRRTVHSYIRKNGTTKINLTDSYSYVRSSTDDKGCNNCSVILNLTAGTYVELMSEQVGSSGNAYAIANQSWIILEYIRGV
jgi:hypothetical protein